MAGITPHGIRYPDGASKAKNLGPELEVMANDIDTYIGSYLQPNGPIRQIVINIAEDVVPPIVESEIAKYGAVTAIHDGSATVSSWDSLPLEWTYRVGLFTQSDVYSDTYEAFWSDSGRRAKDVPLLRSDNGKLPESVIPDDVARKADIPDAPPQATRAERILSLDVPIFAARVAAAKIDQSACAVVFVGSSTTARNPGYVVPVGRGLQDAFLVNSPSTPQFDNAAQFTKRTAAGIHIYSAGHSGTSALSYLTDDECDRIAALNPALMHHMVGSNDFRQGQDPETYRTNMLNRLNYLDSVLPGPVQHVLVQQYERRDGTVGPYDWDEYGQVLQDIAGSRADTVFLDVSRPYALTGIPATDPLGFISGDLIHQVPKGYQFMRDLKLAFYLAT